MWKLLIVEDELGIYHLINNFIDYASLQIELIGYARDGSSAAKMIEWQKPDIVITDISMPTMSGLEMIQKINEQGIDTRFIIISGYAQFDYAQTAIKLGVEDYLIKPINQEELNHVLARTIERIAQARGTQFGAAAPTSDIYSQKKLRSSMLMGLVYDHSLSLNQPLSALNEEYSFSFQAGFFSLSILHIDCPDSVPLGIIDYISEHIATHIRSSLLEACADAELIAHHNRIYLLSNYTANQETGLFRTLQYALTFARDFAAEYSDTAVTLVVGLPVTQPATLYLSMQSALRVLHARILLGLNRVISAKDCIEQSEENYRYTISRQLASDLNAAADCKQIDALERSISALFEDMLTVHRAHPLQLFSNVKESLFFLLTLLRQKELFADDPASLYLQYCDALDHYYVPSDLTHALPSLLCSSLRKEQESTDSENSKVMQTALAYIHENYNKNIQLEDVAEQVYLSSAYFGILFKKETGENFSSYLTNLRMEKAKELLKQIDQNISEIAYQVGYANKRYFSRIFKKNVGVTPQEFRKIHGQSKF